MARLAMRPHDSLLPRSPGGTGPGAALSLLAHAGLLAALAYGVAWHAPPPDVVSAELWAAVPQVAAPLATEPEPTPVPVPVPRAVEKPTPAPAVPDAQIAIEKARKEQAAKAATAEREKNERLQRQKEAAEEARIAQQREENLKRMQGQIASSPGGRGNAVADAAPSASYAGRLVRAIKPNIVLTDEVTGNPAAEVEVNTAPSGSIIGRRLLKPSGSKAWDDAVLRAIDRTEILPRDTDGRVPPRLVISFRPLD